jgi:DNA-binding CsgD family transcriptional regulator
MIHFSILSQVIVSMLVLSASILTFLFREKVGKHVSLLLGSCVLFFLSTFGHASYMYFRTEVSQLGPFICICMVMLLELISAAALILVSLFFLRRAGLSKPILEKLSVAVISVAYTGLVVATLTMANPMLVRAARFSVVLLGCFLILYSIRQLKHRGKPKTLVYLLLGIIIIRYLLELSALLSLLFRQETFVFMVSDIFLEAVFMILVIAFLNQSSRDWQNKARDLETELVSGEAMVKFSISAREKEVIELIIQGKTNKEIAEELFISLSTVKDHIHRAFKKTGVNNRLLLANLMRKES